MDSDKSNVIVNLDDFCEDIATDETFRMLEELKLCYPEFKVTMFAIPQRSSDRWMQEIKKSYPWLEFAVHGSDHEDMDEWMVQIPDKEEAVNKVLHIMWSSGYYVKGFKAPQWRITQWLYQALRYNGIWVATSKRNMFAQAKDALSYKYDDGKELCFDMHYRRNHWYKWHGHIQSCYNGLPDRINMMMEAWPKDSNFHFISEVAHGTYQKIISA